MEGSFEDAVQIMPGDVIATSTENVGLCNVGGAGGLFQHVILATTRAEKVEPTKGSDLHAIWPTGTFPHGRRHAMTVWKFEFLECARQNQQGILHGAMYVYVHERSRKLTGFAEIELEQSEETVVEYEVPVRCTVLQSPVCLRSAIVDHLVSKTTQAMLAEQRLQWSWSTGVRAAGAAAGNIFSLQLANLGDANPEEFWQSGQICVSVVIVWWQRYFQMLAESHPEAGDWTIHGLLDGKEAVSTKHAFQLLCKRYMNLKSDRSLPETLFQVLEGWTRIEQIPVQSKVVASPPPAAVEFDGSDDEDDTRRTFRALHAVIDEAMQSLVQYTRTVGFQGVAPDLFVKMLSVAWERVEPVLCYAFGKKGSIGKATVAFIASLCPQEQLAMLCRPEVRLVLMKFVEDCCKHHKQQLTCIEGAFQDPTRAQPAQFVANLLQAAARHRVNAQCSKPSAAALVAKFFVEEFIMKKKWLLHTPLTEQTAKTKRMLSEVEDLAHLQAAHKRIRRA